MLTAQNRQPRVQVSPAEYAYLAMLSWQVFSSRKHWTLGSINGIVKHLQSSNDAATFRGNKIAATRTLFVKLINLGACSRGNKIAATRTLFVKLINSGA